MLYPFSRSVKMLCIKWPDGVSLRFTQAVKPLILVLKDIAPCRRGLSCRHTQIISPARWQLAFRLNHLLRVQLFCKFIVWIWPASDKREKSSLEEYNPNILLLRLTQICNSLRTSYNKEITIKSNVVLDPGNFQSSRKCIISIIISCPAPVKRNRPTFTHKEEKQIQLSHHSCTRFLAINYYGETPWQQ